ncbi:hypothetical protein IQ235_01715 [Oscillatoriales cyanobacterium LEGE 11467]|uniref:Uncharacterized protein n=1 Tax=Zarconia navalis LEGE 11467 TaxID=1828826 RepID=A0A928VVJ5_9CYAN|nr:hypothetical protein [Zarconia navalis]MBE9039512.1 hypothetical protein [Zarconia navalis LEGE 11467]
MIQIKKLKLPPLPQCEATELTRISQKIYDFSPILPPHILLEKTPPPRQIDEILADIEGDRTVTLLEWVYCLQSTKQPNRQHPNECLQMATAIWRSAQNDGKLKRLLEWRLRLYDRGLKEAIAPSLVKVATIEWEKREEFNE